LAEDDLLRVAESVSQAVRAGDSRTPAALKAASSESVHPIKERPEEVDAARKAQLLRDCDERARAESGEVDQVMASYAENRRVVEIFNSEGIAAGDDRTRVRLGVQVIARRNGRVETGHETLGGHVGFEILETDPTDVAQRAARKAVIALDAVDAPSGKMPVVVGNAFGGVLLHEAVGHGLEADHIQKRSSVWAGKLGEMVAEGFVTAYDDGRMTNEWGSDGIDDEGTPTQRTTIIEDGKLVSYLYDLIRARKDNVASTGNGRRESFRHLPVPRMTNTYFAPGAQTKDELIAGVERGLYAVSFGGGQVEPATGDFVFGVSEAYLIENGEITSPVRGATLIGNGIEALAAVDGIADDLEIATGFCGKAGQRVAAGVGQPHVRIRALTVGGTAG
jgi:TldD protein